MRVLFVVALVMSMTSIAQANNDVTHVVCRATQRQFVSFTLLLEENLPVIGGGVENFLDFELTCKNEVGRLICTSNSQGAENLLAVLRLNEDGDMDGKFFGVYSNHQGIDLECSRI